MCILKTRRNTYKPTEIGEQLFLFCSEPPTSSYNTTIDWLLNKLYTAVFVKLNFLIGNANGMTCANFYSYFVKFTIPKVIKP